MRVRHEKLEMSGDERTKPQSSSQFERRLGHTAEHCESLLTSLLTPEPLASEYARPARLLDAMRHAVLGGGKRLRPMLVVETAALFGVLESQAMYTGAAFELLHCYSLVHDDLPAMDNDDTRRGKPTVHKAFGEATAVLAGDALQTLAFDVLSRETTHNNPAVRAALVQCLAKASGIGGMAGGQMLDLEAEGRFSEDKTPPALALGEVEKLQRMKTGALLLACCQAGTILGEADDIKAGAIARYGRAIGFAFQLADDLLDAEGDAAEVGKAVGKDAARNKATYVSTLSPRAAKRKLAELVDDAKWALRPFGDSAEWLVACADFIAARKS
jgi:farnesyl diphosphate synthase